jgi:hypothetical protein
LRLPETLIGSGHGDRLLAYEADAREPIRRPTIGCTARGVTHYELAANHQERGGALGNQGRGTKAASDDQVIAAPMLGDSPDDLGTSLNHRHPVRQTEGLERLT